MPTTVHVPPALLKKIDSRAKALGVSRNRFIVDTLSEKVDSRTEWSEDFVRALRRPVTSDVKRGAEEMLRQIELARKSRMKPVKLG